MSKLVYRSNLELDAGQVVVAGGQGDYIVVRSEGPNGQTEAAIHRDKLDQVARMMFAMKDYLSE